MKQHPASRGERRRLRIESLEPRMMLAADFGDAPAPFPVTLAENGARHEAVGPMLGFARDTEADGAHSAGAIGDGFDEDGVVIGALKPGQVGAVATVNVQNAPTGARLDAWIDFDADGNWGGAGEQIADNLAVVNGDNAVTFNVPATAHGGTVFARFRLSTAGNLGPQGAAADGEVEDVAAIISLPPAASGNFNPAVNVATGLTSAQSALGIDLDRDGRMDVLTAAFGTDQIAWQRQNANGTFTSIVVTSTADGANSAAAADFDNDGQLDVAAASQLDNELAWYERDGQTFTQHIISNSASQAKSVTTADLDGDGDFDIICALTNRILWAKNNGLGVFTTHELPVVGTGATSPSVADIDGDGDLDIAYCVFVATPTGSQVGWYKNDGNENFTVTLISNMIVGARRVIASDLDRDGDVDLVGASSEDDRVVWYENDGNENFTTRLIASDADGAIDVFVADIDGDGDLDVASASANDNKLAWYQNNGAQQFYPRIVTTAAASPRSVHVADIDADGDLDMIAAQAGNARVTWYENLPIELGDYDKTGLIDGGDFLLWQRTFLSPSAFGAGADGSQNGVIDNADFLIWQGAYGSSASATFAASAPSGSAALTSAGASSSESSSTMTAGAALAALTNEQVDDALAAWPGATRRARRSAVFFQPS